MTKLELLGAFFGLLSVGLTVVGSVWCWPTGLVNTALFMVLFAGARLYGDVVTNAMFFVLGVYGWREWLRRGPDAAPPPIRRASRRTRLVALAVVVVATPLVGGVFATFTDAALPYPDAGILVLSFVAQAFLAKKLVDSWLLWIAVDVLSIAVYLARALYVTAALYVIFLVLAILGLRAWQEKG